MECVGGERKDCLAGRLAAPVAVRGEGPLSQPPTPHAGSFLSEGREEEVWEDTAESPSCVGLCNKRKHSRAEGAKRCTVLPL